MASSLLLKKKPNLLTGFPFRHTNCLTINGHTFCQPATSNPFTRSGIPNCNAAISDFLTSSAVTVRQAAASNRRTPSSLCSSVLLTRSIVPLRRPSEVTDALISRFINFKEFHIDVSGHDSDVVRFMKRVHDKLDPFGWWYLVFDFDENKVLHVDTEKKLYRIGFRETDEGMSLRMKMPGVDYYDMKVSVEDNCLFCEGIRQAGTTHNFKFELPQKTYQPGDVKGKIENGVLWVTFINLKKQDVKELAFELETIS